MKYGIIDVGSNSIRLMIIENGETIRKVIKTTQIAEGLATHGLLQKSPMSNSVDAIVKLNNTAIAQGATQVFVFATEAVRSAPNGDDFVTMVREACGLDIHILSSEEEAIVGFYGAYSGYGNKCVVDIGGASTEIAVGNENSMVYANSQPIGAVRLRDLVGENETNLDAYIKAMVISYGEIPSVKEAVAIGGTATAIVAVLEKMSVYRPEIVHNYVLSIEKIEEVIELIINTPINERSKIIGLPEKRRNVMVGGCMLLIEIMKKIKVSSVRVSEKDNLEGYYKCFVENSIDIKSTVRYLAV